MTEEMQNIEMNDKETPDTETPDARSQDSEQQHARMQFLDNAKKLHEWCFVADGHNDLLPRVLFKRAKGRTKVIEQDYLPLFREARVNLVVSSLFIGDEYLPEMALRRALGCISALRAEMEESPGLFSLCRTTAEIEAANERGELAILLSFEGLEPIGNDLSLLGIFHELGVRGVGIAWSRRNYAADGCSFSPVREGRKGGLTEFGVRVLEEALRLGMYLDISHLNDEGVEDVFSLFDVPVTASHSNCRALTPVMRNLTDEQTSRLAARGGVQGLNVCSAFAGNPDEKQVDEKDLADHADHIVRTAGPGVPVFGFDFCDEFRDFSGPGPHRYYDCISGYPKSFGLTAELLSRGYPSDQIAGIIGGNLLRFLKSTIG